MKHLNGDNYCFHKKDTSDACFCCNQKVERLIIVRHMESNRLVHLCLECMIENSSDYLLDNTKAWPGEKQK